MRRIVKAAPGHDCRLCIDGFSPCGVHNVLGPVMHTCPTPPDCDGCGGAVFPTDGNSMHECAERVAALGYAVDFCMVCFGVILIVPMTGHAS
jgi:hypothetical protein